jgi:hypothetical protein
MAGAAGRLRHTAAALQDRGAHQRQLPHAAAGAAGSFGSSSSSRFELHEASIESIHAALRAGAVTCVQLVELYLARIACYNGQSCRYPHGLLGDEVPGLPAPSSTPTTTPSCVTVGRFWRPPTP